MLLRYDIMGFESLEIVPVFLFEEGEDRLLMASRKKTRHQSLELALTWLAGCILLLVANMTIFDRLDASVGDPWFNYVLGTAALVLLVNVLLKVNVLRREVLTANSQISRIDGMGDQDFAGYMAGLLEKEGWNTFPGPPDTCGALLYLEKSGARACAILHTGRRKLTRDYVGAVLSHCRERPHPSGEAEIWCITNTRFTSQARKEASQSGIRLMDRERTIRRLAKSASSPILREASVKGRGSRS